MLRKDINIIQPKGGCREAHIVKKYDSSGKPYLYTKCDMTVKRKKQNHLQVVSAKKRTVDVILLNDVISEFLLHQQSKSKVSTVSQYKRIIDKHISPEFGNRNINDINTSDIDLFAYKKLNLSDNGGVLSSKTVRDILTLLKSILLFAKDHGYCKEIPGVSLPHKRKNTIDLLCANEQRHLWKCITNNFCQEKIGVLIALCTGMRIGEICALRWWDINLENKTITVKYTLQRVLDISGEKKTQLILDAPKSESSERTVPIMEILLPYFLLFKGQSDELFVLTGKTTPIEPSNYYSKFRKWLAESDIPAHTFHSLRHTFATRCIETGGDPKSLAEILGHADISITLALYVHPSMEQKRRCMNNMSNNFLQSNLSLP